MSTRHQPVLDAREREHSEKMVRVRDEALAATSELGEVDRIIVLINASAKAITMLPRGAYTKAIETAQKQLEENVRKMLSRR